MLTSMGSAVALALLLGIQEPRQPAADTPGLYADPGRDPYARLFRQPRPPRRPDVPPVPSREELAAHGILPGRPELECPIKVFRADRAVDPDIGIPVPTDGVDFKIRRIQPPCGVREAK